MIQIVDSNALCYAAFFKTGNLRTADEKTGVIYGFLRYIFSYAQKYNPEVIAFAWDSEISIRKALYPKYKGNRGKTKSLLSKEDYAQFEMLRKEILPSIGFRNNYYRRGYEGDDLIAILCKIYVNDKKIVVSGDGDLYQLLDDNTMMLKPKKGVLYTKQDFEREWRISPTRWGEVKSIAGCKTDNVKGMNGVGEITAIKILKGSIKKEVDKKVVRRNRKLVVLPLTNLKIKILRPDNFNIKEFKHYCYRFGFNSFLSEMKKWQNLFMREK